MQKLKNQSSKPDGLGFFNAETIFSCVCPEYLDESFCRRLAIDFVHRGVPKCGWCGFFIPENNKKYQRFYAGKRLVCSNCGRTFTAKSNTPFSGMRGSWRNLILLCILSELGFDSNGIAGYLRVKPEWVRDWLKKIGLREQSKPDEEIIVKSAEGVLDRFISSCVEKDPQAKTPARDLYRSYNFWTETNTIAPAMKQKRFGGILRKKGFQKMKSGTYKYLGIKLRCLVDNTS